MSNGWWGGRFPAGNLLCSRLLFGFINLRLSFRRVRNGFLTGKFKTLKLYNTSCQTEELKRWLERGYDRFNIGGGPKNLVGFINIDFAPYEHVERVVIANILDLSFIPSGCSSHIHSNHVIEHLTDEQLSKQFREYFRILKPGGLITLRCPNALGAAYGFWFDPVIETDRDTFIRLGFPKDEDFGNPRDAWMHRDLFGLLHWFYGDTGNIQNQHLNVITPTKIRNHLEKAGFILQKITEPEDINIVLVAAKRNSADVDRQEN